ncbi:hypothetical protein C8R44DRAFT_732815 [Mycena epipterygia]|nr:hypothetical protein C8R44DRAFT_732815 [Mycena epipterygia]
MTAHQNDPSNLMDYAQVDSRRFKKKKQEDQGSERRPGCHRSSPSRARGRLSSPPLSIPAPGNPRSSTPASDEFGLMHSLPAASSYGAVGFLTTTLPADNAVSFATSGSSTPTTIVGLGQAEGQGGQATRPAYGLLSPARDVVQDCRTPRAWSRACAQSSSARTSPPRSYSPPSHSTPQFEVVELDAMWAPAHTRSA